MIRLRKIQKEKIQKKEKKDSTIATNKHQSLSVALSSYQVSLILSSDRQNQFVPNSLVVHVRFSSQNYVWTTV